MIYLAIDTATENCSAALWVDGELFYRDTQQPRLHAELILPFVDELLQDADISKQQIEGIIVGQGPGAFTGVRIGVAVAQALALALNVEVVPVSNLKALAYAASQQIKSTHPIDLIVATDARMNEVYWAKYRINNNEISQTLAESVAKPDCVDLTHIDYYIGNGFSVYQELKDFADENPVSIMTHIHSHAKDMLMLVKDDFHSQSLPASELMPVYLREP